MRFVVEAWSPEYGSPAESGLEAAAPVELDVEVPVGQWAPLSPSEDTPVPQTVLFTDGVRRVDARVWIACDDGTTRAGICASFAAGAVRCDGRAEVVACEVRRGLFSPAADAESIVTRHGEYQPRATAGDTPEMLALALQQRMGALEVEVAHAADACELIVIDGPLTGRQNIAGAVGYVKTHHVAYLPPIVDDIVAHLGPGQRTPLFLTTTSWSRFSWYLRLPVGAGHAWAGVVRCEASADLEVADAVARADAVTLLLPRFASRPHKDPRAPQNLYPIAGLERTMRRRLGDAQLLYRALLIAALERGAELAPIA